VCRGVVCLAAKRSVVTAFVVCALGEQSEWLAQRSKFEGYVAADLRISDIPALLLEYRNLAASCERLLQQAPERGLVPIP
jgi:hypothetical protein